VNKKTGATRFFYVCRVGGFAADAVIVIGADVGPDDLAANHHRVGGPAANPTES
jgi:hypothetical protein